MKIIMRIWEDGGQNKGENTYKTEKTSEFKLQKSPQSKNKLRVIPNVLLAVILINYYKSSNSK